MADDTKADGLLNPEMRAATLRLHMGELSADEALVARAAIRWANAVAEQKIKAQKPETKPQDKNPWPSPSPN